MLKPSVYAPTKLSIVDDTVVEASAVFPPRPSLCSPRDDTSPARL